MRQTEDPVWQAAISIVLHERIQVDQHEYLNRLGLINAFYGRISVNIQWSGPEVTTVDAKSSRSKTSKIQIIFSSLYIKPVSFFFYVSFSQYVFIEGANPGVEYHFLSPQRSDVTADQVKWKIGGWGACTQDCAGGNEIQSARYV